MNILRLMNTHARAFCCTALILGSLSGGLFLQVQSAEAQDAAAGTPQTLPAVALPPTEPLDRTVTHFYTKPDLTRVFQAIEVMVQQEAQSPVLNFESLALFLSEIYRKDPDLIEPTIIHFSRYRNDLNLLPWMAAHLSGTVKGNEVIAQLKTQGYDEQHQIITASPQVDYRAVYPRSRPILDALWVHFYASGDLNDAAKVLEVALFDQKLPDGSLAIDDAAARKAAEDFAVGSLVVHAAKHPHVMSLLVGMAEKVPEDKKEKLVSMIASAQILNRQFAAGLQQAPAADQ